MNIYLNLQSGICNQLIPLISIIRICEKKELKLNLNLSKLKICGKNSKYNLFDFFKIKFKYNNFEIIEENVITKGNCKSYILDSLVTPIYFNEVCHIQGLKNDNLKLYNPYPYKNIKKCKLLHELSNIIKNYLFINDNINLKLKQNLEQFNNNKIIGLHLRTKDGSFVDFYHKNRKQLYLFIFNILKKNKNYKIYLSCDDIKLEKNLKKIFKDKILMLKDPIGNTYEDKFNNNYFGVINSIIELYSLSKVNNLYGTPGSSFSFMSWLLSDLEELNFWINN
jgi:hypothetical protein